MFHKINSYLELNKFAAPVIILIAVFTVYFSSLPNAFVLDDPAQVTTNAQVLSFNIPQIFLGSSFGIQGTTKAQGVYYKPLMSASYALIYKLSGASPSSFHLFQIMVHFANAVLVYFMFKRFFKPISALFVSLLFGIHTLNAESVLYISALQEPLFFIFGGLGFLIATKTYLSKKDILISVLLFILSLLSKETGLLFIITAVLYRIIVLKDKGDTFKFSIEIVPALILYAVVRHYAVGIVPVSTDKPYPIMRLTLFERFLTVPAEMFYYIRNFFFPYDIAVAEHWVVKSISFENFFLPLLMCAVLFSGIAWFSYRLYASKAKNASLFLFFTLWFCIGMAAHLNIFPLDVTVADRWFYFPSVGLLGMLSILLTEHKLEKRNAIIIIAGCILSVLFVRTVLRTLDWRDGLTLASHDIRYSKDSFPLENNLGFELINHGDYKNAEIHVRKSVELGPWWWLNWNNLGTIYRHRGYTEDPKYYKLAEKYYEKSIENTSFYLPYENLAELLTNYDTPQKAQAFIIKTSKKLDLSGRLWFDLALVQLQLGDIKGAQQAATQAVLKLPDDPQIVSLNTALQSGQKIIMVKPKY